MTCRAARNQISLYSDGRLSDRAQNALNRHLEQCEGCRQYMQQMSASLAVFQKLDRVEPRAGGWTALRVQIEQGQRTVPANRFRFVPRYAYAAVGSAAVVIAIAVMLMLSTDAPQPVTVTPESQTPSIVQTIPVPQPDLLPAVPEDIQTAVVPEPEPAPVIRERTAAAIPQPRTVSPSPSVVREEPAVRPQPEQDQMIALLPGAEFFDLDDDAFLEPDPEFSESVYTADSRMMTEEAADMVSLGLQPLIMAAEDNADPLGWLTDFSTEDWL